MIKLGEFNRHNKDYFVFYNEEINCLEIFFKSKIFKDMECWSVPYENVKYIVPQYKTVEDMKNNYKTIWCCLERLKPNKVEKLVSMNVYDIDLWKEAEAKEFQDFNITSFKFEL